MRKQRRLTSISTITTSRESQVSIRDRFRPCSRDSSGGKTKTHRAINKQKDLHLCWPPNLLSINTFILLNRSS